MNLSKQVLSIIHEVGRRRDRYYSAEEATGEVILSIPAEDRTFEWVRHERGENLPPEVQRSAQVCGINEPDCTYLTLRSNRDGKMITHLTAQMEGDVITAIRGVGNTPPSPKYHRYIRTLLKSGKVGGYEPGRYSGYRPHGDEGSDEIPDLM